LGSVARKRQISRRARRGGSGRGLSGWPTPQKTAHFIEAFSAGADV
jgi:hypothetical protein